jgi:hypothetical protein
MTEIMANGPWIVAQMVRVRKLEADIKNLLVVRKTPAAELSGRMAELKFQLTLLELAIQ